VVSLNLAHPVCTIRDQNFRSRNKEDAGH